MGSQKSRTSDENEEPGRLVVFLHLNGQRRLPETRLWAWCQLGTHRCSHKFTLLVLLADVEKDIADFSVGRNKPENKRGFEHMN